MEVASFLKSDYTYTPTITVEGSLLVVPSQVTLPPRCIRTNYLVSEKNLEAQNIYWCSPIVGLLIVPTAFLFLFVYLLVRKKGTVKYGLDPDVRARRRKTKIKKVVASFVLFFAIPFATTNAPPFIGAVLFVSIVAAMVLLLRPSDPLRVVKYSDGHFWLKGCSQEFLAEVEAANKASSSSSVNE